jgi:hypothetical protein
MAQQQTGIKVWHLVALVILAPTIFALWWMINAPATKGASLLNKATNTDKMLANYEWFHESATSFDSRVSQIKSQKALLANEDDRNEKRRLNMELAAVQQTCRDLAANYSAKSNQIHVGYLKGKNLPSTLNAEQCE